MTHSYYYNSPVGKLLLEADDKTLLQVAFVNESRKSPACSNPIIAQAINQLDEYFAGKRREFDIPLAPQGTRFQQQVWRELQAIDYGTTASYQNIARQIDNPQACRAVGNANNKNPIVIIIPCHRIIGANGAMVGYGGGVDKKQWLLELEKPTNPLTL